MDIDRTISVFLYSKLWQIVKVLGQGDLVRHNTVVVWINEGGKYSETRRENE